MSRPKRTAKKPAPNSGQTGPTGQMADLREAMLKRKKADLVDVLIEFATADRATLRRLKARFGVAPRSEELISQTRQAIRDATAFNTREINRNFAYDHAAYAEVKRNLGLLIASGQLPAAMELALELMKLGSYQIEMSDEGMMTGEVEDCLNVVIDSLPQSDVDANAVIAWCKAMRASDRMDFVAKEPLKALLQRLDTSAPR